jgi:hypothetical protein
MLKPNFVQGQSRLTSYNILATLSLSYGCEIWTKTGISRLQGAG